MILLLELESELEQAKKHGDKIRITDIAIKKVRYIEYKDLMETQNAIMQRLAKGKVHYLYKDEKYFKRETIQLFNECVDGLDRSSMVSERYKSVC